MKNPDKVRKHFNSSGASKNLRNKSHVFSHKFSLVEKANITLKKRIPHALPYPSGLKRATKLSILKKRSADTLPYPTGLKRAEYVLSYSENS